MSENWILTSGYVLGLHEDVRLGSEPGITLLFHEQNVVLIRYPFTEANLCLSAFLLTCISSKIELLYVPLPLTCEQYNYAVMYVQACNFIRTIPFFKSMKNPHCTVTNRKSK